MNLLQTLKRYKKLLTYVKSAVTRNYSEKSINNILDYVSASKDMGFLEEFYATTLAALEEQNNEVRSNVTSLTVLHLTAMCRDSGRKQT